MSKYDYYGSGEMLLQNLDQMVRDPADRDYLELREVLRSAYDSCANNVNPFGAGAPVKYGRDVREKVHKLRKEGRKISDIAAEVGCSRATVSRILKSW